MFSTLAIILTILATIGTGCWFIWRTIIDTSMGILGKILFGTIMTPIVCCIVFYVTGIITVGLATVLDKIFGLEYKYTPSAHTYKESKKEENPVDKATIARCQVLLDLVDSVKYLDSPIAYDSSITSHAWDVKVNQYGDYDEANDACDRLENDLLCYKSTLAMTTQGYRWLRSMGEI